MLLHLIEDLISFFVIFRQVYYLFLVEIFIFSNNLFLVEIEQLYDTNLLGPTKLHFMLELHLELDSVDELELRVKWNEY